MEHSDTLVSPHHHQFAFLETIVTAVTDEFPYYLRPKKAVFSGLICVSMYLMGLVLTTDVSDVRVSGWGQIGRCAVRLTTPALTLPSRDSLPRAAHLACVPVLAFKTRDQRPC